MASPQELLALLAEYRNREPCRRCECLDWAISQLQLVGDYALACEAAELRVPEDRIEPAANCQHCPPIARTFAWLQEPTQLAAAAIE